jgi:hypothetical protein
MSTPFNLRPNISLNVNFSSTPLNSTQSTVFWSITIFETASQPSFSLNAASNTFSGNIQGIVVPLTNFTYDFRPTGLQTITLASGSFTWNQAANGNGVPVSGTATVNAAVIGTATDSSSHTPAFIAPPRPVWSTAAALTAGKAGRALSRTVTASPVTSYSLVTSSNTLGLTRSSNVISGTPTGIGTASFTIRANNYSSFRDRTFTIAITSGLKMWNGTAWVNGVIRVWNGTTWVANTNRIWNGTTWADGP